VKHLILKVAVDAKSLATLVGQVERSETLWPEGRLTVTEREAAEMLGIAAHVLRDARERGEIHFAKAGRTVLYTRAFLVGYLNRHATHPISRDDSEHQARTRITSKDEKNVRI
jgi:hypothetical protein